MRALTVAVVLAFGAAWVGCSDDDSNGQYDAAVDAAQTDSTVFPDANQTDAATGVEDGSVSDGGETDGGDADGGDGGGPVGIAHADYCTEIGTRMCELAWNSTCCSSATPDSSFWGTNYATCLNTVIPDCEADFGPSSDLGTLVTNGVTTYDPLEAENCANELDAQVSTCSSPVFRVIMDYCLNAFQGTLAVGATCDSDVSLPDVQCINGYCPDVTGPNDVCVEFGGTGDTCSAIGPYCDFLDGLGCDYNNTWQCVAQLTNGSTCIADDQCLSLNCDGSTWQCADPDYCTVPPSL